MKRVYFIEVLGAVLIAGPIAVMISLTDVASAQTGTSDSAQGSGTVITSSLTTFDFSATSGPEGENATGEMIIHQSSNTIQVEVDCLRVTGNRAVIGGLIAASTVPPPAVGSTGNWATA